MGLTRERRFAGGRVWRGLIGLMSGLVACAWGAPAVEADALQFDPRPGQAEGDIEVWAWNIAAVALGDIVPGFNEQYPHVRVSVNMTGANMLVRLMLSLSSGMGAPDVSQIEAQNAPRFALTGRLTDLSPFAMKYADRFAPASWGNCVHEGKLYAIPWDVGPCAVYYKRDLFQRYGIDPEAIETWDDYIAAGQQIVAKSGGRTRMLPLPTGDLVTMFEILIQQNGGQVFDDEGRVAIDSPEVLQVMRVLKAMLNSGIGANVVIWGHAYMSSFGTETIASYPMASWFGGFMKDNAPGTSGNWGVFRLPALEPGGLRTSTSGGSVLIIPKQCRDKEAAWAYVRYAMCTPEGQLAMYRQFDLFPALLDTYTDPFFDEPDPFYGGQRVRRLFCQDIEKIPMLNRTRDWREARRYMVQAFSRWATNGAGPPEPVLRDLAQRLSRRLDRELAPPRAAETP